MTVLKSVGKAVSFTALMLAVLAALVLIVFPRVTGSYTYTVLTQSMEPGYPPGTFIVVKPIPFDELQLGDVITYQLESGKPEVVTHRITGVSSTQQGEPTFITKGDNNSAEDPVPVREIQVRGKLFYAVPYVGFVANAAGQGDRNSVIYIAAIGLIAYGVFTVGRGLIGKRKSGDSHAQAEDAVAETDPPAELTAPGQKARA
ncbi:signal peptidase I [Arthrobacter sp. JZ12]|uniref:signal peptidase I n=1 Tax=Arthrobacter sp. JZ12 TaxID=2654190 RepID=UPI002B45F5C0|nr:signal peptidase I [Arthrobacter sp. JZ12]WRH24472.1 signal peptidase I [Arthrobacter sp. JZ12]